MKAKERKEIIKYAEGLTNEELEKEYYNTLEKSLGSLVEDMCELGYDMRDIKEREEHEKFMSQKCDILQRLCEERGIKLF